MEHYKQATTKHPLKNSYLRDFDSDQHKLQPTDRNYYNEQQMSNLDNNK